MRFSSDDFEIEAWVETLDDQRRFDEFRETEYDNSVKSYLACEEGKSFRVKFRCIRPSTPHPDMQVCVKIDGREIRGRAWTGRHKEADVGAMYVKENGREKLSDLIFAAMPKVDDEIKADLNGHQLDPLCKIEVVIRHGEYKRLSLDNDYPRTNTRAEIGSVYEKKLKMTSTIQAANMREAKVKPGLVFTPAERDSEVCQFVWNYFTHDKLRRMGVFLLVERDQISQSQGTGRLATPPITPNKSLKWPTPVKRELSPDSDGEGEPEYQEIKRKVKIERGLGSAAQPIPVIDDSPLKWRIPTREELNLGATNTGDGDEDELDDEQPSSPIPSGSAPLQEESEEDRPRSAKPEPPSSPAIGADQPSSPTGVDRPSSPFEPVNQRSSPDMEVGDLRLGGTGSEERAEDLDEQEQEQEQEQEMEEEYQEEEAEAENAMISGESTQVGILA